MCRYERRGAQRTSHPLLVKAGYACTIASWARPVTRRPRAPDPVNQEEIVSRVALNQPAPDFGLPDFTARAVNLSDFRGRKNVLLVFNRGFA